MRDPNRIDAILARLAAYWHANPDLRLGQIVVNAATATASRLPMDVAHVFHVEDGPLADAMWPEGP